MYKLIEKKNGENGMFFPLKGVVHEIGRASSCDISLSDNNKASRIHARLEKDSDGWWIVDLNSTNGTFVNKERIKSRKLTVGDEIAIGDSLLIFDREDDSRPDDMSTEFSQPKLDIRVNDDNEIRGGRKRLIASILALLMLSVAVWVLYSVYINTMNKIHMAAVMINSNAQKIELMHGDIEAAKKISMNMELIKSNLPAIIDFLAKVQENPRILDEIRKKSPEISIMAFKKGLNDSAGLQQHIDSHQSTLQQILEATEMFKMNQDRARYNLFRKTYAASLKEMDKSRDILIKYSDELMMLNALLISLDKLSSKIVPGLSQKTGIILDASNKAMDDISRLIKNMEAEKEFLRTAADIG